MQTLFQNPLFRWGMGVFDAIIFVSIALLFFEDRTTQLLLFVIAAVGLILTPMVLKRAAMEQE